MKISIKSEDGNSIKKNEPFSFTFMVTQMVLVFNVINQK
jgi:hypothetical protein